MVGGFGLTLQRRVPVIALGTAVRSLTGAGGGGSFPGASVVWGSPGESDQGREHMSWGDRTVRFSRWVLPDTGIVRLPLGCPPSLSRVGQGRSLNLAITIGVPLSTVK